MMMSQGMGGGTEQSLGTEETYLPAQAEQQQPAEITQLDTCLTTVKIEEMLKQLEEIWLDPEVREVIDIDEDEWLAFVESVKSAIE
jgi:hypothetical protein